MAKHQQNCNRKYCTCFNTRKPSQITY